MLISHLSIFDYILFFSSFMVLFIVVIYGHRRMDKGQSFSFIDHLLFGRKLTLPLFVGTLVSTWYGGIFGVTQIAFESGLYNFLTQGVFWYISYLIFAFFMVDSVRDSAAVTLPDYIGKTFGERSRRISALFNVMNIIPTAYAMAAGFLFQAIFGGEFWIYSGLSLLLVLLYSSWGGLRSVVLSDMVQFGLMFSSVIMVVVFSYLNFGGIEYLQVNLPTQHWSPLGGHSLGETLSWGLIALSTLVDPNFYQRSLAASSKTVAKRGILISIIFWMIFDFCTTFGAMYARASMGDVSSDQAYLIYGVQLLPEGFKGLFLAGLAATIFSTLDSYLFLSGATLTHDLFPKDWKRSRKNLVLTQMLVALITFSFSQFLDGGIKEVWKIFGSLSAACILTPVLLSKIPGVCLRDQEFALMSLASAFGLIFWKDLAPQSLQSWDPLYGGVLIGVIIFFLSFFVKRIRV